MNLKLTKIYFSVQDYLMILFGTLLYGFGFNAFILSNEIVTGGVSGICALIFFASNGLIPVSVSYFVINVALLVVALKILGLKFLIKTIFGVFSLSASLSLFEWLLKGQPILHDQPFMAIIIGAFMCGAGLGLVFSANGSTGGTDIIGAVINKYKNISIGRILLFCDFFIISSSFFLFHNVDKIVFGFVEMVISNYVLDMVLNGNRQSVQFLIFSQKYDEIADRIIHELGRGCTILDGEGGYSRKPVKVVVLLAKKSESVSIFQIVSVHKGGGDAELGQGVLQQIVTTAVDGLLSYDVVTGLSQCLDGVGDGSCTGSSSQSSHAAFQSGNALLEHILGGVGQTAVDVAGVCQTEAVRSVLAVAEHIGSGLVNGHCAGIGRGIGLLLANVQLKGLKFIVRHCSIPLSLNF